ERVLAASRQLALELRREPVLEAGIVGLARRDLAEPHHAGDRGQLAAVGGDEPEEGEARDDGIVGRGDQPAEPVERLAAFPRPDRVEHLPDVLVPAILDVLRDETAIDLPPRPGEARELPVLPGEPGGGVGLRRAALLPLLALLESAARQLGEGVPGHPDSGLARELLGERVEALPAALLSPSNLAGPHRGAALFEQLDDRMAEVDFAL